MGKEERDATREIQGSGSARRSEHRRFGLRQLERVADPGGHTGTRDTGPQRNSRACDADPGRERDRPAGN